MYKLGHQVADQWVEHCYTAQFQRPGEGELQRLVIGVPKEDPDIFMQLVSQLTPPYFILYVLHTPRGEGNPGRYQSPEISQEQLQDFVSTYSEFLSGDARFDIWAHSQEDNATVVWDRHNCIYAYGPLEQYEKKLLSLGFTPGSVSIPSRHEHNYRAELDGLASQLLAHFDWIYSPLRPEDEQ